MDENSLQIAWRLSTGGNNVKSNAKLLSQRNIDAFNVPEACILIQKHAATVPLQKSSGLLHGTVLVYKRKCELGFRETQNVKWAIQRIKDAFQTQNRFGVLKQNNAQPQTSVRYLKDDPKFNVDFLGLNDNQIDLKSLLKDLDSNESSVLGLGMVDMANWRGDHGLREMSVSTDVSDLNSIEYIPFDERKIDVDSDGEGVSITGAGHNKTKDIWDHDLDFGFDANGNTVDVNGDKLQSQVLQVVEEADNKESIPNFEFDSFDDGIEIDHEYDPPVSDVLLINETKRKRKNNTITGTSKKRKVIYDEDIYLSILGMKQQRDQFISNEFMKRIKWHSKRTQHVILNLDPRSLFMSIRTEMYPTPQSTGVSDNFPPEFGTGGYEEIELGRRRRSSSVSSVEVARQGIDTKGARGNSSSLQFDFNIETSQNNDSGGQFDVDLSADIAHLDIDLIENDTIIDPTANMDTFIQDLESKFHDLSTDKLEFGVIYPHNSTSKKEAVRNFHMILHCATKNKLDLFVSCSAIGKSQWNVLTSEDIMVVLK